MNAHEARWETHQRMYACICVSSHLVVPLADDAMQMLQNENRAPVVVAYKLCVA